MKTIKYSLVAMVCMLAPTVHGQGLIDEGGVNQEGGFGGAVAGLTDLVNTYLIPFMIALAVLGFIYGVFLFFIMGSSDEEKRAQGRSLMLYALIGFVAIVALWGIVTFLAEAFGFDQDDSVRQTPQGLGTEGGGPGSSAPPPSSN